MTYEAEFTLRHVDTPKRGLCNVEDTHLVLR